MTPGAGLPDCRRQSAREDHDGTNSPDARRLAFAALLAAAVPALAQDFPDRPVRLVIPFAPGGSTDVVGRIIAERMAAELGQQIVVENMAGAGGSLGAGAVARAAPDGYTILMGTVATHALNPLILEQTPYDPVADFAPVSLLVIVPNVLAVNPELPVNSVQELIDLAKKEPGTLAYASSGNGTPLHLSGELFKSMAGVDIQHVPYQGSGPALTDVIGNQVPIIFDNLPSASAHITAGALRPLGVTTAERDAVLPRHPDHRRDAARLRDLHLERAVRAGGHPARGDRAAERSRRRGDGRPGRGRADEGVLRRDRRLDARRRSPSTSRPRPPNGGRWSRRPTSGWSDTEPGRGRGVLQSRLPRAIRRAMILYPAIDLKDGQCVRLLRGDMGAATVFGDDPAAQARAFAAAGCALAARGRSRRRLRRAAAERRGGRGDPRGGRPAGAARRRHPRSRRHRGAGSRRACAGWSSAPRRCATRRLVRAAARAHPGRIAVGVDARDGRVAVEGWTETSATDAIDLARRFEDAGVAAIVYTDIDRDGALAGPNLGGDRRARPGGGGPGDRQRRHRRARRPRGAEGERRAARRRHRRPGALRRPARPRRRGAAAAA